MSSYVGGNPPPGACQVALSGSPVHRCMSCVLERIRGRTNATSSPRVATREKRAELLRKHPNEASVSTIVPPVQQRPPSTVSGCERWWREEPLLKEMIFAGCFGSALDVDHFLAAGSLRLSRAIRVSGRPWGHSVAALLAMVRRLRWTIKSYCQAGFLEGDGACCAMKHEGFSPRFKCRSILIPLYARS